MFIRTIRHTVWANVGDIWMDETTPLGCFAHPPHSISIFDVRRKLDIVPGRSTDTDRPSCSYHQYIDQSRKESPLASDEMRRC